MPDGRDRAVGVRRAPRGARRASRPARAAARRGAARRSLARSRSAVCRARRSGLASTATGGSASAASRSPSSRACSRPSAVSSRSSSGSPGGGLGVAAEVDAHAARSSVGTPRSKARVRNDRLQRRGWTIARSDGPRFLGVVGVGVAGLFFGRDATTARRAASCRDRVAAIVPTSGWRIYTIGSALPRIDPARLSAHDRGRRRAAGHVHARRSPRAAAGDAGLRLPLRHGLERLRRPLGGRPVRRPARRGRPATGGEGAALRLRRGALRRHALAPAGARGGRAARARHGRQAALGAARVPGACRDAADVRLQERQVGDADRGRAAPRHVGYWEQRGYDEDAWVGASN